MEDESSRNFRLQIAENMKSFFGSPARYLPKEMEDRHGRVWRRSEKSLGRGACGEVFLGMNEDGAFVALKVFDLPEAHDLESAPHSPVSPSSPDASPLLGFRKFGRPAGGRRCSTHAELQSKIDELTKEVNILKNMTHNNIVNYLGCVVAPRHAVVCMEYVSGGSLEAVIDDFGPLNPRVIRRYTREILSGLACLHTHDVVHCDLKPANLLMTPAGQVKLADFGAAKRLSQPRDLPLGTPLYMAPESCDGEHCCASDVWSLGIIVCQMFTGTVPYSFEGGVLASPSFLIKLSSCLDFGPTIPSLSQLYNEQEAAEFLGCCLQRDPAKRPPAARLERHRFVSRDVQSPLPRTCSNTVLGGAARNLHNS